MIIFEQNKISLTQMQIRWYIHNTTDNEHCFDLSGLISAVGVTDIYSRQYIPEINVFACGLQLSQLPNQAKKKLSAQPVRP